MSVIIEALKKLKSESVATGVRPPKLRPQNKRAPGTLSPAHALLYSVILLILVSALLSGFTHLSRQTGITSAPAPSSLEKKREQTSRVPDHTPETDKTKASTDYQEVLLKLAALEAAAASQPIVSSAPEILRKNNFPYQQQAPDPKMKTPPHVPGDTTFPNATLSETPYITEGERRFLANREKSLKVEKLVHRIERAISRNEPEQVSPLLERLEKLKGEDDAYVLKLKAFWLIRQNSYLAGAHHLEKVLKKNRDDLEAGINMAVIEIHTHQLEKALARLNKMKRRHPDNPLIHNLILKIKQAL